MHDNWVFEVKNLKKTYKGQHNRALNGVSQRFETGTIVGLLGPNGAGKSTFIKICVGLLEPDTGEKKYNININMDVGYVPEESLAFHFMTGLDFLQFVGGLRGMSKKEVIKRISDLEDVLKFPNMNSLISTYSNGNKQKVLLMSALLHSPKLLVLDEPFNGFDPEIVANFKEYLLKYAELGNTVIFSSHILDTVSQICSKVIVINEGRIIYEALTGEADSKKLEQLYIDIIDSNKLEEQLS